MRRGWSAAKSRWVLYGEAPWGYRLSRDHTALVADAKEQRTLAVIRHMRATGHTLRQIADFLNGAGLSTRRGTPFTTSRVHDILAQAGEIPAEADEAGPRSGVRIRTERAQSHSRGGGSPARVNVPAFARADRVEDLPLSHWTRIVFGRLGLVVLGDMHGRETAELCALPGITVAMIDELLTVLSDIRRAGPKLRAPLVDVLDDALERLDPQLRSVVLRRHGGAGEGPLSFAETAARCGVGTGEWARKLELRAIGELRRLAGPAFCRVLRELEGSSGARRREWLTTELKRGRDGNKHLPWAGIQEFHVRVLVRLAPGLAAAVGAPPALS